MKKNSSSTHGRPATRLPTGGHSVKSARLSRVFNNMILFLYTHMTQYIYIYISDTRIIIWRVVFHPAIII